MLLQAHDAANTNVSIIDQLLTTKNGPRHQVALKSFGL